jgi:hypothetical protein
MLLGMVCMTLSHRFNQTRSDAESRVLAERFYLYWGLAVRSLSEQIHMEDMPKDDSLIAGILTLLLADVSTSVHTLL